MNTIINFKKAQIMMSFLMTLFLNWNTSIGQNVAMEFDGSNDFVELTPINGLLSTGDFTIEMQFFCKSTGGSGICFGDFRRLFSVSDAAGTNRFEVGECQGNLFILRTGSSLISTGINIRDNSWHCISAVRSGNNIFIYLDGVPLLATISAIGFNADRFILGHWSTFSLDPDWLGLIDEVKIWNKALTLTPLTLTACDPCVLTGNEPGLICYWRFDNGLPNGNNTALNALDYSASGINDGVFSLFIPSILDGFKLTPNTNSNFVSSSAPILYPEYTNLHIVLKDPVNNTVIPGICEGDPVHFSIVDLNGIPVQGNSQATVTWEYSDNCLSWTPCAIQSAAAPSALFNSFSFVSTPNHLALACNNCISPTINGFADRCYRAIITVSNGIEICHYIAQSAPLKICCKLPPLNLNVIPSVASANGHYCEGDILSFQGSISGIPAPVSGINNYSVVWSIIPTNNIPNNPGFANQLNMNYGPITLTLPGTLLSGTYCIQAIVSNCYCPSKTLSYCITVDKKPVCGTITGSPIFIPNVLMPDPDNNPDHYLICPGQDASVEWSSAFTNCNPVWQYKFPGGSWNDLGASNSTQNTNTLPHLKPANSPYLWPPGVNCIFYRVMCLPSSFPNSGCPPCYSNEIRICLKQAPLSPVITAVQNPICKGDISYLSVQNPDPNCNYEWYGNGLQVGFGSFLNTGQKACYWVTCNDGCFVTTSNKVCLDVCQTVAISSCSNPICPYDGDKITLDASIYSYSTCGYPLSYTWTWIDQNGVFHSVTGPVMMDIPAPNGTTYILTVTDTVLGCVDSINVNIDPCSNP